MKPLKIRDYQEAMWLNRNVLHCGWVSPWQPWDTAESWPNPSDRVLARAILLRYRKYRADTVVTEAERRQLAICCRED